jgi:hypothetical protein
LEAAGPPLVDQRHHLMEMLKLFFDVMRQAYMSVEFRGDNNVGYMMMTITDPRLKEEIYDTLNPKKLKLNSRSKPSANLTNSNKAFFL